MLDSAAEGGGIGTNTTLGRIRSRISNICTSPTPSTNHTSLWRILIDAAWAPRSFVRTVISTVTVSPACSCLTTDSDLR